MVKFNKEKEKPMISKQSFFSRRQFIALGAGSAGTVILGNLLHRKTISNEPLLKSSASVAPVYHSNNGLLELDLEAKEHLVNLSGQQAYLLTYNGQIPTPRLEAKPGDKVRIHFTNNLQQPTNIHYHGLHIPITE